MIKIHDFADMTHAQLALVVDILGGSKAKAESAPLKANWKQLEAALKPTELEKLVRGKPAEVADFLLKPANP